MSNLEFGTEPFLLARSDAPDTSHAAAAKVNTTKQEALIYQTIHAAGLHGLTMDEAIEAHPKMFHRSVGPRITCLVRKKYVVDSGFRRPGKSGADQRVVIAAVHAYTASAPAEEPVQKEFDWVDYFG